MSGRSAAAGREGPMSLRAQSGIMDGMAAFQLQPPSLPLLPTMPPSMANTHNPLQQSLLLEAHHRQQAFAQQSHPFAALATPSHFSQSVQRSSSQLDRISLAFQAELANLSNMRSSLSGFANPLPIAQDPFAPLRHLGTGRQMAAQHQQQSMAAAVQLQAALGRTPTGLSHALMGTRAVGMDPTAPLMEAILQSHRLQELEHLAFSSQASDREAMDSAITALLRRGYVSGATTHPEDSRSADASFTSNRNPHES
jgi:hypothetical protein